MVGAKQGSFKKPHKIGENNIYLEVFPSFSILLFCSSEGIILSWGWLKFNLIFLNRLIVARDYSAASRHDSQIKWKETEEGVVDDELEVSFFYSFLGVPKIKKKKFTPD